MIRNNYFEGWYFKCSTADQTIAVIVGQATGSQRSAFIQIFMTGSSKSYYIPYEQVAFIYREEPFYIQLEENIFTERYMKLKINYEDLVIEGRIEFDTLTKLPQKFWKKGLMGPFAFLPFMECYHDVLSMNHKLKGTMQINGITYNFKGGKGYIERDWGTSFPSSYIWMQCNHFKQGSLSFMLAIASIPFLGTTFTGFLCCLSIKGQARIFATYTGARIEQFNKDDKGIDIIIRQGKERIHVHTHNREGSLLKAPNKGAMKRTIYETLESKIELKLFYNEVLKVHEVGENVAFESV